MEFAGRTSGVLSLTQELTRFVEIERAVAAAVSAHAACAVVEFSAAAEVGVDGTAKGRYQLFVEFEREPAGLEGFAVGLRLRRSAPQNRVYREHRAGRRDPRAARLRRSFAVAHAAS